MYGDDDEEDLCYESEENPFDLLCCDGPCGRAFHSDCLELDASDIPPEGQPWYVEWYVGSGSRRFM